MRLAHQDPSDHAAMIALNAKKSLFIWFGLIMVRWGKPRCSLPSAYFFVRRIMLDNFFSKLGVESEQLPCYLKITMRFDSCLGNWVKCINVSNLDAIYCWTGLTYLTWPKAKKLIKDAGLQPGSICVKGREPFKGSVTMFNKPATTPGASLRRDTWLTRPEPWPQVKGDT